MKHFGSISGFLALVSLQLIGVCVCAQAPGVAVEHDIDGQVWVPLLRASDMFEAEGFLAVQSVDLVRVSEDRNEIYGGDLYRAEIQAGFDRARQRKIRRTSTVRFLTRTHTGDLARDTGIFRSEVTLPEGAARVTYTAFEVILRKEGGRWKILVDQDAWRGGSITETEYLKGTPMTIDDHSSPIAPAAEPR